MVQFVEGMLQIANVFLSIVAGIVAISMFHISHKKETLQAWKPLIIALVLFAVEEILGALRAFGIWETPHLTHIVPSFILALLIWSLTWQIYIAKTKY